MYQEFKKHHLINKMFYFSKETLTGFKWMGNVSHDLMNQGKHVLFAFEEAIGKLWVYFLFILISLQK